MSDAGLQIEATTEEYEEEEDSPFAEVRASVSNMDIKGYAQTGWEQNVYRQLPIKGYANIHEQRVAVDEEARHTSDRLGTKRLRLRKFISGQVRHTTWYLRL